MSVTSIELDVNDVAKIGYVFRVATVLTDPTAVVVTVKKPDASTVAYTHPTSEIVIGSALPLDVANDLVDAGELTLAENTAGVGLLLLSFEVTTAGLWQIALDSTGTAPGGAYHTIKVRPQFA